MIFAKLSRYVDNTKINSNLDVKVNKSAILIAVKNEKENIKNNFNSFLSQKPLGYELLVIDDYSTDNSLNLLLELSKQFDSIKVMKNKSHSGKKQALSQLINDTEKEYLIFTDADCNVKSNAWMQKMISKFDHNISIVLGYSPYKGNGFLNKFIRFETFMAAVQYFSYALIGLPYMGVGRNMAIKRSFFIDKRGYKNHLDLKSGSDDLFINANATRENTAIQLDPNTFVETKPPKSLSLFIKQKTRHISTSFRYKNIHKILLGIYSFSHIGFYLTLALSLLFLPMWKVFAFWLFRMGFVVLSSYRSFYKLKENDLILFLPILDFLMFIYYSFIGIYYFIAPKNKW